MCRSGGMSPEQRADIDAANRMEAVNFSTPHGSQNVDNPNYATYTDSYPDLVENYNANWRDKGVSKAEYGAMHWNQSGRNEGRSMPGVSSFSGEGSSDSGSSGGLLSSPSGSIDRGPYPLPNEYFPLLTTDYVRPQAYDDTAFGYVPNWIESGPFPGLLYQTGTQQYHEAFPMEQGILEYQPNRFGVGPVQFMGAFDGPMNVVPPEELFTEEEEEEEEEQRGGTGGSTPVGGIGTGGPEGVTGITDADMLGMNLGINPATVGSGG
jgi:hypothetical protein